MKLGITINRPPRDGQMAFVRSPEAHAKILVDPRSSVTSA